MELRPAKPADLPSIFDIDAAIESHRYLHIDRAGDALDVTWKIEDRPLRERVISTLPMDDELQFMYRQILNGIEEGIAQVAEHEGVIVASMIAQPKVDVLHLLDLRVDFDHRREGLATALLFMAIQTAREQSLRAVAAVSTANNDPANQLLVKLDFHIAGLDSHRHSNHDLVKETVTLLWYATM